MNKKLSIPISAGIAILTLGLNSVFADVVIDQAGITFTNSIQYKEFRNPLMAKCESQCSYDEYLTYIALMDYELKKNKGINLSGNPTVATLNQKILSINP